VQPTATTVPVVPLAPEDRRRLRALARRRDDAAKEIAQAIVEVRDKGGSLREIADELGVSHGGVAFIEQRQRKGP
jgi:transcriptional regulator with XRE-family HTH domain